MGQTLRRLDRKHLGLGILGVVGEDGGVAVDRAAAHGNVDSTCLNADTLLTVSRRPSAARLEFARDR